MDEPKVKIYRYMGKINKFREYEQARKQWRKRNSVNWREYQASKKKGF